VISDTALADLRRQHADTGMAILRGAIPPDLLGRLRVAAEQIRVLTRAAAGPSVTRPPGGYIGGRVIDDHADRIDTSAFEEFDHVPLLRAFLDTALGAGFENDHSAFTIIFEAEDREIVQGWHRDYRDNVPWLDVDRWWSVIDDVRYFNQYNAALYHDASLWIVPGSHCRDDTAEERAHRETARPPAWPEDQDATAVAGFSQAAEAYAAGMPGAVRVVLAPGDIAVYRDSALHLGHYIPTIRRATLHGHLDDDVTRQFFVDHFHDRIRV
jgi:hypothetical protein